MVPDLVREAVIAIGRSKEGVEFDAVDSEPVRLFFLDCAPSERVHLAVLARLSRLLADQALLERLLAAASEQEVIDAIGEVESRLVEM